eukprot:5418773-Prymnesium_polylepis.1
MSAANGTRTALKPLSLINCVISAIGRLFAPPIIVVPVSMPNHDKPLIVSSVGNSAAEPKAFVYMRDPKVQ